MILLSIVDCSNWVETVTEHLVLRNEIEFEGCVEILVFGFVVGVKHDGAVKFLV